MSNRKPEQWILAVEAWKSGAVVTDFMRDQIASLRDADGDPLPEAVRGFLADLVFLRVRPRKGRPISKTAIREAYRTRLFIEQLADEGGTHSGETPSERVIQGIAKDLNLSEGGCSLAVHPRRGRKS